ncbi:MAG: response regulator, partial [Anaerolineales bacterium]
IAQCVREGHRIISLDVEAEMALKENPLLPETRSMLVFPLVSRGQTNGAITLQSTRRFAFTQEDVATLELMVNQLANVLESTTLYERSQSSLAETRMLYRIAQQITDARDAESVLKAAVDGLSQRAEPDWITAGLLEPQDNPIDLRIAVSWSRDSTTPPIKSFPLKQIRRLYEILRTDDRFVTPDATQDPMVDTFLRGIYVELGFRATAAFQLHVRGAQYGTIMIHRRKAREFTTAELNFYENVARQAFVALENISLMDTTREQAERRDILNQVLQTASSSLDLSVILRDVGEVIAKRLDMPTMMWVWDKIAVNAVSIHDAGGKLLIGERDAPRLSANDMLQVYNVIETGEPAHFTFSGGESNLFEGVHINFGKLLEEGFAVPLKARDTVYGVMVLGRQQGHEPITPMETEFLLTAAANVSVSLETASLYHEAQETAEKLKEVDLLKNQFMANMSHELRTPLNSIIGFSRVMIKGIDGPLTEMQETDLTAIYESGRHLLELINDILDISKINSGKMEIIYEPVDLRALIQSVMSTAMGFIKGKSIELRTDVPEDMPMIVADGRRIRQVLTNLLGNAGKFTEQGFIEVGTTFDDHQVILTVQDTGIGIPADRIHAVFEQFEQVDSSSTRKYGGTGLGVPLSREFVRLHGGDMWIQDSIVGQGTTFAFSIPIHGPGSSPEEPEIPENKDTVFSRVILAVDDDESVITLLRRYLEKEGYRVFGLTSGERVVAEAKRLKPYAITLDVIMPGKDGWTVIQELQSDPETRQIPIIICSVIGETDKALSMGVANYILKPISEQALLEVLSRIEQPEAGGYVLVVDDNPDDRKLLHRILENAGYRVQSAEGGAAAIKKITEKPPYLVILDLMMPDVDGFVVLETLKGNKATRNIPVVVVTAKELSLMDQERLNQRVQALLQKGLFDQQQLLEDVSTALERLNYKPRPKA